MSKYGKVLAAVDAREAHLKAADSTALWKIGDALVAEIAYKKSLDVETFHDGSHAKLAEVAAKIKQRHPNARGYEVKSLAQIRDAAHTFPKKDRKDGVSLWVHGEAGTPEFMDYLFKEYGKGRRGGLGIDVPQIRAIIQKQRERLADKRRKATADAQEKLKKADTPEDRRRIKQEIDDNIEPPKGSPVQVPDKHERHELHLLADLLRIERDVSDANKTLRGNLGELRDMEINPEFIENLVDEYTKLKEVVQQSIDFLSNAQKARFTVMKGGKAS